MAKDSCEQKTVLILDLHGTTLSTDEEMLHAIRETINCYAQNSEKIDNLNALEHFMGGKGIKIEEALVKSKKSSPKTPGILEKLLGKETYDKGGVFEYYDKKCEDLVKESLGTEEGRKRLIAPGLLKLAQYKKNPNMTLAMLSNSSTNFLKEVTDSIFTKDDNPFNETYLIGSDKAAKDNTGAAIEKVVSLLPENPADYKVIFVGDAIGDHACVKGYSENKIISTNKPEVSFALMELEQSRVKLTPEEKKGLVYKIAEYKGFFPLAELCKTPQALWL